VELAIVGSIEPPIGVPAPYTIAGGFRLVELAALALCHRGRVVIYVEEVVDLPTSLEGCRFEIRKLKDLDLPQIPVGCVPHMLKSLNLKCGDYHIDLGGEELVVEPFTTIADLISHNVEIMETVFSRLKLLGIDLIKGDLRGEVKGDIYIRGKLYEYTYVQGPAVVGPNSEVLPFTYIRPGTVLYYNTSVRDEVKNSIIDSYVRKQHTGYLGDAYVGPFVNFGAATTVSNLKNTLGLIKPSYSAKTYKKLGPVVGAFTKTAIGTLIYGGRYIGYLTHLYGLVDRDVPPATIYRNGNIEKMYFEKALEYLKRDLSHFDRLDLFNYYRELLQKTLF